MSSLCDRLFLPVVTLGVGVERVGDRVPRYVRSKAHGDGAKHDDLSACKGPIIHKLKHTLYINQQTFDYIQHAKVDRFRPHPVSHLQTECTGMWRKIKGADAASSANDAHSSPPSGRQSTKWLLKAIEQAARSYSQALL